MPWVHEDSVKKAWAKYQDIKAKMPKELIESGCIVFSAYIPLPESARTESRTSHISTLFYMKKPSFEKLQQFLGPHGEALFWAWAHRQGKT